MYHLTFGFCQTFLLTFVPQKAPATYLRDCSTAEIKLLPGRQRPPWMRLVHLSPKVSLTYLVLVCCCLQTLKVPDAEVLAERSQRIGQFCSRSNSDIPLGLFDQFESDVGGTEF